MGSIAAREFLGVSVLAGLLLFLDWKYNEGKGSLGICLSWQKALQVPIGGPAITPKEIGENENA